MKKILKYGVVPVVVGAFLLSITVMLLPVLINVQKFLPQIEKQVTRTTGRPFSVGSDFGLTFFPWLSVTFSDMRLGNPEGFIAGDFIQIDSFEARVKLLPLLANKIEVSRFVVSGLNVNLQREQNGKNNWDKFSQSDNGESDLSSTLATLFTKDFFVELFAITGGSLSWNDRQHDSDHQINDLMLVLNDLSSEKVAKVDFKAKADGHQMRAAGSIGPISSNFNSLYMDLRLQVNDRIQGIVKGECSYPLSETQCDLQMNIPAFSLSGLYGRAVRGQSDNTSPALFDQSIELDGHFLGSYQKFRIDAGSGIIGDAPFSYRLIHDPAKEVINDIELSFNHIDFDHYFSGEKTESNREKPEVNCPVLKALQSAPYVIRMAASKARLAGIGFTNVNMELTAEKGVMNIDNGVFDLHGGKGQFDGTIGLYDEPVSLDSRIELQQVETESFSKELIGIPFLSGPMKGKIAIKSSGLGGSELGKGFVGNGNIQIDGGAIAGIALLENKTSPGDKKTEFTTLFADVTIGVGVVRLQPLNIGGSEGITEMSAVVQFGDKSFSVTGGAEKSQEEALSLSGRYGSAGLEILGFTDVHETKIHELRDAQTLVDEKMPIPVAEDVNYMVGTPLIDPAIVAQRFGLKPEMITPDKVKKAYSVGKGQVRINAMQILDTPDFLE